MNPKEALDKLEKACELIFEVEKVMNINTSSARLLGYQARIKVGQLKVKFKQFQGDNIKTL